MAHEGKLTVIHEVLQTMGEVVRSDGGEVSLNSYDPEAGRVVFSYRQAVNDDCSTCAIDADMLQAFLQEALRSHGLEDEEVTVEAMT
jgi:Fe-S cluster biogenesis protein NfuA